MPTAYVYDVDLKIKANKNGMNYWYEYIKEIFDQLGVKARSISRHSLKDASSLEDIDVLIIGDLPEGELSNSALDTLTEWVKSGGVLIGFATEGMDGIFGNRFFSRTYQIDDYSVSGYFDLNEDSTVTSGVHSPLAPEQKLLVISDIRNIKPDSSTEIGHLYGPQGVDHGFSAITERRLGLGYAYYFAFNVPKTVWILHQGRPVVKDVDGDGRCTVRDLSVIGSNSANVPYADEIILLIQNMIGRRMQPFVYQIPPIKNEIPDALFYFGGDDEAINSQLDASQWMKKIGLPYHINILYPNFNLSKKQAEEILKNGHEISLHYNFVDEKFRVIPEKFSEESIRIQRLAFKEKYGLTPICTTNHGTPWLYWDEFPLWLSNEGGGADNSFVYHYKEPSPTFGFGTSFPYYFYSDFRRGNRRLDVIEEPVACYEAGYDRNRVYPEILSRIIEVAAKYHYLMGMFYHSYRIAEWPACRRAIMELLRLIEEKGIKVAYMSNDEVYRWWKSRSETEIYDVKTSERYISFKIESRYDAGVIIKIPLGTLFAVEAFCDGCKTKCKNIHEFGQNWAYVVVPSGSHRILVNLSGKESGG